MSLSRSAFHAFAELTDPGSLTRVLLDRMTEGVSLSGEDGRIVYTNPAEDRLFGYLQGELIGRHVSVQNAYPPEENERIVAGVIAELRRSGSWQGEWRNRRKDGSVFTTRSRISALEIEGRPHWLCVQEDVTEESATTQALQDERSRLALATEAADIGIWDWDIASARMTYSTRARAILGFPEDQEITPEQVFELIHPGDRDRVRALSRSALDPDIRARDAYEYRIVRSDGAVRWVLASGEPMFEDTGTGPRAVRYLGVIQDITSRRELEEAERSAAQRLRLAVDAGRMVVWDLDVARDTVAPSPELNRLLGFPEDGLLDLAAVRARYYPGEQERLQAEGQAALARGETSFEGGFWYNRPDGAHRWLRLRCEVLFDEEARPVRVIGVLSDETERKRAEEDLRASEARLQLASAAAGAGVWDWNLVTGETIWSLEEYALFGVDPATSPTEVVEVWTTLIHPDDRSAVMEETELARREGGSFSQDYRVILGNGETRWIRSHLTAVAGPDGRITRMVGIELDVTEDHAKAEALQFRAEALQGEVEDRRQELDRFYSLSSDLFAVAGFDGFLKSINPAWSHLLGYSDDELLSQPFVSRIHPDDHASAADIIGRLRAGSAVQQFQDRLICRDGRVVWIAWAAVAEGDRFYAVGRDITHEREREEILRLSQKMEALGQLTGGIAHDFNNLLQAVQGSFALIRKRPEQAEKVRLLAEQGLDAARRGGTLTAQLLAFSQSQQLEVQPVPIARALEGMHDLLQRSLGPLSVVAVDVEDRDLAALVDPTQLEMAILNLGINARDAMPDGGTITISAEARRLDSDPELPAGDYVLVCVKDNGTGMTPEVAQRAFEPFFSTKGLGKGTGLGLSQVYAMARQSGGSVRLDTGPGQGTRVCIFLRRAERLEGDGLLASASAAGWAGTASGATVLVIDDDDAVRRSLIATVEALGHRVLEASNGPEGLSALDLEPDLVLVDFAMPGMNGAEVAEAMRRRRPDLPIILVTGYADMTAVAKAIGPDSLVLRKPFELEDLEAALDASLGARRAGPRR